MGNWGTIILTAIASGLLVYYILPDSPIYLRRDFIENNPAQIVTGAVAITRAGVLGAILVGLAVGTLMSILIKLMSIVSLVIAPTLAQVFRTKDVNSTGVEKKIEIKATSSTQKNNNTFYVAASNNKRK
jgi:hypothetical protein